MPLNLFYTMVQKSQKWPKTQIKGGGGPALNTRKHTFLSSPQLSVTCPANGAWAHCAIVSKVEWSHFGLPPRYFHRGNWLGGMHNFLWTIA